MIEKFESILAAAGGFGKFQRILCFTLIPLTTGLCALVYYAQVFALYAPQHWCDGDFYNTTQEQQCSKYFDTPCHNWKYNFTYSFPNVATQNNWICDQAWKSYFIQTMFWIGNTVGVWLWGVLADNIGRKPTILFSHAVYLIAGIVSAFLYNFWAFAISRFVVGISHITVTHLPYVLVIEFCGTGSRNIPLLTVMASYTLGSVLAPLLAQVLWDWQWLIFTVTIPALLVLLSWKILPESPSWLVAKGRHEDAKLLLRQIAKTNGRKLDEVQLEQCWKKQETGDKQQHYSVVELFKRPRLRRNTIAVIFVWMISCLSFYSHCFNTANLSRDVYMSFILGAALEVPAWIAPFLINYVGRKWPLIVCYYVAALLSIVFAILIYFDTDESTVSLTIALMARCIMTAAYYITLQFCPEIFPTIVRVQGIALAETVASIAIFVSPFVVYLAEFGKGNPLLFLGIIGFVGGATSFLLPETAGKTLPQSLDDAENFGKGEKLCQCHCLFMKRRRTYCATEPQPQVITFESNF